MSDWKAYETEILGKLKTEFPRADLTLNAKIKGQHSKALRQIDILVKGAIAGFNLIGVIECKYFSKKIDVKIVEGFVGFLDDVHADFGVIITNMGFTKAALSLAKAKKIRVDIVNFSSLPDYHFEWDSCEMCPLTNGYHNEVYWHNSYTGRYGKTKILLEAGACSFCNTIHIKCNRCGHIMCISDGEYDVEQECLCPHKFIVSNEYIGSGMSEDVFYFMKGRIKTLLDKIQRKYSSDI